MLKATGADGQSTTAQTLVSLYSPAKLGGLTLPVTDLTVPVPGGQPITVTRVYNSQQADVLGDFGYGWSLQATTSALRLVTEPAEEGPTVTAFRPGDLVYITLPGGGQHAFQFWPTPVSYEPGAAEGTGADPYGSFYQQGSAAAYSPQFLCVDGSGCTLTVPGIGPSSLTYNHENRELYLTDPDNPGSAGSLFDPATYIFTTPDGSVYNIDGASGAITNSTDANGQTTDYSDSSKIVSGDVSVRFVRNPGDNTISSAQVYVNNVAVGSPILYGYTGGNLTSVQARDDTTTQYAYADAGHPHFLTTVTDPRLVPVLNAGYDPLGELSSLTDASGNPASVGTGADDGSGDSQKVSDLTPQHNTTQDINDSEGNVIREIKSISDSAGNITGYQVTVHQYAYYTGNLSNEIANIFPVEGATTPGYSNQNTITSQTDYQPFTVTALDDALGQPPTTMTRQVSFGAAGDSGQGLPVSETDYLAGGVTRVTTYSDYKLGRPQTTTVATYAASVSPVNGTPLQSATTRAFVDDAGNLRFSFDALGQGTEYDYDSQGQLTETWQTANWSSVAGTWDAGNTSTWHVARLTILPQSKNVYYTADDVSAEVAGAYAGQVKYSTDAAGNQTWFAYDALGNQVLAYKLWLNPTAGQPNRWVGTTTTFDPDGRPTGTTNAVYLDDGSGVLPVTLDGSGNLVVNATLYSLNGVPDTLLASTNAYNAAGQVATTTDQYGRATTNLYDVNNNVAQTTNANGTVVRSVGA